jgi:hypothetical protein
MLARSCAARLPRSASASNRAQRRTVPRSALPKDADEPSLVKICCNRRSVGPSSSILVFGKHSPSLSQCACGWGRRRSRCKTGWGFQRGSTRGRKDVWLKYDISPGFRVGNPDGSVARFGQVLLQLPSTASAIAPTPATSVYISSRPNNNSNNQPDLIFPANRSSTHKLAGRLVRQPHSAVHGTARDHATLEARQCAGPTQHNAR